MMWVVSQVIYINMINGQTACGNLQLSDNRRILYFGQRRKKHYENGRKNCIIWSFMICTSTQTLGDEVKDEMGGACMWYKINSFIKDFGGVTLRPVKGLR